MRSALLVNDTSVQKHWGCRATVQGLLGLLADREVNLIDRVRWATPPSPDTRRRIGAASVLIINSEGTCHGAREQQQWLGGLSRQARDGGKVIWWVNGEVEGCSSDTLAEIAAADYVAVRDVRSHGELAAHGIPAELSADCSWLLPPAPVMDREDIMLVVAGVRRPAPGEAERLAARLACRPVWAELYYPTWRDGLICDTLGQAFAQHASVKWVLTGSYHGGVHAMMHGTPWVPIERGAPTSKLNTLAVECYGPLWREIAIRQSLPMLWGRMRTACLDAGHTMRARALRNIP